MECMLILQNIAVWVNLEFRGAKAHSRANYSTGRLLDRLMADL